MISDVSRLWDAQNRNSSRPLARTRADDYEDKHQWILDKAAEVFAAKGFATASFNDLSAATGMSKSAIYHYHRNKEAILHAILTTHVQKVFSDAAQAVEERTDPVDRFRAFLVSLLEDYSTARAKHVVLINDTGHLSETQQAEVRRLERRLVDLAVALLDKVNPGAMQEAAMRKPFAMMLFGLVNWTYTWYNPTGSVLPTDLAEHMADLFLHGFLPQHEATPVQPARALARG